MKYGYATGTEITTSSHNWDFVGRGTATAPSISVPRGKVTGGSSAINGQVFLRGVPEDYNLWAQWGNDEWSYENCLDAFKKLEADLDFGDRDHRGWAVRSRARRFKRQAWEPDQEAFYQACLDAGFADVPDHNRPRTRRASDRSRSTTRTASAGARPSAT